MHNLAHRRLRMLALFLCFATLLTGAAVAQGDRPASPTGSAATQIGDAWIDVEYSRPILRGRNGIFGSGAEYGQKLNAGAPVWRAGANVTTRIKTGLDLEINGTRLPAGEYSFFIEREEGAWTAILSKQQYMETPDRAKIGQGITWGSYGYSPDHDVLRAPMQVTTNQQSIDQLTIVFADVSDSGGTLALAWDNQVGLLPFKVAK